MKILIISTFIVFLSFSHKTYAQGVTVSKSKKEIRREKRELPPEKGDIYLVAMPTIAYDPTSGLKIGVGGTASFYLGDPATTVISSGIASLNLTTKNQLLFLARSTMYTEKNNFVLNGDWRYLDTSQPTYGLGTGPMSSKLASNGFEIGDNLFSKPVDESQLLLYKQIRFYETVSRKIRENMYLGLGYHLDVFTDIRDMLLDTVSDPPVLSGYYMYNEKYGFKQTANSLSGISLNFLYDSRDNQNNAYMGQYVNLSFRINPTFLGSSKGSTALWLEYRKFLDLTKDHHNMLGFWGIGNFVTSGVYPVLDLPAIGEDQYGKTGRGYTQGRFRGQSLVYGEAEYRKHIAGFRKIPDFFGMVVFANAFTATNEDADINLFQYVNYGLGAGFRFMISKKSRSCVAIDYGVGNYGSSGFYLRLNETF